MKHYSKNTLTILTSSNHGLGSDSIQLKALDASSIIIWSHQVPGFDICCV